MAENENAKSERAGDALVPAPPRPTDAQIMCLLHEVEYRDLRVRINASWAERVLRKISACGEAAPVPADDALARQLVDAARKVATVFITETGRSFRLIASIGELQAALAAWDDAAQKGDG